MFSVHDSEMQSLVNCVKKERKRKIKNSLINVKLQ